MGGRERISFDSLQIDPPRYSDMNPAEDTQRVASRKTRKQRRRDAELLQKMEQERRWNQRLGAKSDKVAGWKPLKKFPIEQKGPRFKQSLSKSSSTPSLSNGQSPYTHREGKWDDSFWRVLKTPWREAGKLPVTYHDEYVHIENILRGEDDQTNNKRLHQLRRIAAQAIEAAESGTPFEDEQVQLVLQELVRREEHALQHNHDRKLQLQTELLRTRQSYSPTRSRLASMLSTNARNKELEDPSDNPDSQEPPQCGQWGGCTDKCPFCGPQDATICRQLARTRSRGCSSSSVYRNTHSASRLPRINRSATMGQLQRGIHNVDEEGAAGRQRAQTHQMSRGTYNPIARLASRLPEAQRMSRSMSASHSEPALHRSPSNMKRRQKHKQKPGSPDLMSLRTCGDVYGKNLIKMFHNKQPRGPRLRPLDAAETLMEDLDERKRTESQGGEVMQGAEY